MKECKLLAFRLIALSVYGDAFDETVGTNLGQEHKRWLIKSRGSDILQARRTQRAAQEDCRQRNLEEEIDIPVVQHASNCRQARNGQVPNRMGGFQRFCYPVSTTGGGITAI